MGLVGLIIMGRNAALENLSLSVAVRIAYLLLLKNNALMNIHFKFEGNKRLQI